LTYGGIGVKIFHTADWHLGKIVHGTSMLEVQRAFINDFIQAIKEESPDVIIIAGDLYDRSQPPKEAVELLDYFLDEIILKEEIPVIAIAGNHDSPTHLHFASKLLWDNGFYVVGKLEETNDPVILEDEFGEVHFHLAPFVDPSMVRNLYGDDSIRTYDDAVKTIVEKMIEKMNPQARHVFVGHFFVTPRGEKRENTSDSERLLSVGGIEYVNASHFSNFNYVALGHLHRAHAVSKSFIRYAGSPLKYSISEEHHKKSYYIVNLDKEGTVDIETKEINPMRDMRTVEGKIEDILRMEPSEDYIFIKLLDRTPVLSPMEKVRAVFPNTLHLERPYDQFVSSEDNEIHIKKEKQSDLELFQAFYKEVKGYAAEKEQLEIFNELVEGIFQEDRE